jgi:antirestriction protein ArdC
MNSSPKKDLYAQVTDSIMAMMKKGTTSQLEWAQTGHGIPRNHLTGADYRGVNVLLLWMEATMKGYASDRWLTYKQAAEMGGQVRKGEKAVQCIFFKAIEREPEKDETGENETVRVISPFWVFNLDQIDGIEASRPIGRLERSSRSRRRSMS